MPRWRIILCAAPRRPKRAPTGDRGTGSRARSRRTHRACAAAPPAGSRPSTARGCATVRAGGTTRFVQTLSPTRLRSLICIAQASARLFRYLRDRASSESRVRRTREKRREPSPPAPRRSRMAAESRRRPWDRNDFWICGISPAYSVDSVDLDLESAPVESASVPSW